MTDFEKFCEQYDVCAFCPYNSQCETIIDCREKYEKEVSSVHLPVAVTFADVSKKLDLIIKHLGIKEEGSND